jgi:uncharacterized membrane protein YkoI
MGAWTNKIHVVATGIVGVQLVAWTLTGFAFTLFDFTVLRGQMDRAPAVELDLPSVKLGPAAAASAALAFRPDGHVQAVRLKMLDHRPVYEVEFDEAGSGPAKRAVLVGASDGLRFAIDQKAAADIAVANFRGAVRAREVEQRDEDGSPSYVVHLDDERATEVTLDPQTGDVTAWRNHTWRLFDTLWSIHVLGYVDRRSPANWPLRVVGFVAAVAASSGAVLLAFRVVRRSRRRLPRLSRVLESTPNERCHSPS